jgi:FlaA1/EpsC-like NDP-sugar epimerase
MRKYLPLFAVDLGDIGQANYLRTFNLAKVAAKFQCEFFVMISSRMADQGGNFINDSLRVAEVSLEHLFNETNTRLIIARICDIAESRGGIVSIIENQIRNRETVVLPSADAQAWVISKNSAAEFILQTLVEPSKNSFDGKVFSCDTGSPIPLIEVTRKLASIYGLKLGADLAVQYTRPSAEAVSITTPKITLSSYLNSGPAQERAGSP